MSIISPWTHFSNPDSPNSKPLISALQNTDFDTPFSLQSRAVLEEHERAKSDLAATCSFLFDQASCKLFRLASAGGVVATGGGARGMAGDRGGVARGGADWVKMLLANVRLCKMPCILNNIHLSISS